MKLYLLMAWHLIRQKDNFTATDTIQIEIVEAVVSR